MNAMTVSQVEVQDIQKLVVGLNSALKDSAVTKVVTGSIEVHRVTGSTVGPLLATLSYDDLTDTTSTSTPWVVTWA